MECLQGAFEAYKVNIFISSSGGKELSSPQPNPEMHTKMHYHENVLSPHVASFWREDLTWVHMVKMFGLQ